MGVFLYYRKSIDKMILVNTTPSEEWKKYGRDHTCELYIETLPIIFDKAIMTLKRREREQPTVRYALEIDTRD